MALLYFLIFTFILFISPVLNDPLQKSFHSYLLEDVREDVVDSTIINLPKRTSFDDILKICLTMAPFK